MFDTIASTTAPWLRSNQRVRYIRSLEKIPQIPEDQRAKLESVIKRYAFRVNDYYLSLIDWRNPADPIRQLIIPREEELNDWGKLDASDEESVTIAKGVQHKYRHTVLLLCNEVCGAYCRYCFRKRLFMHDNAEISRDLGEGIEYIASNPNITNVLLTGGDPLLMSTRKLTDLLRTLRGIQHVEIIRIGSKMPAFNPWRLLDDPILQDTFRMYSLPRKRIHLMAHFDHPRELTDSALQGLDCFIRSGVVCVNQCPLIKGVNDDPVVLSTLFKRLSYAGCPQYYVFQGRPTAGNEPYRLPIVRSWQVFTDALAKGSGLSRRARLVMSHSTGKIEIVSVDNKHIYLKYHRAKDPQNEGRFMVCRRNDKAFWLDDLEEA